MKKVGGDYQTLYQREEPHPLGLPLATHADPSKVNNEIPSEAEMEASVRRLRLHREGGHTRICAEHFKQWQKEAYIREQSNTPPWRERWFCLVDIVQHIWRTG